MLWGKMQRIQKYKLNKQRISSIGMGAMSVRIVCFSVHSMYIRATHLCARIKLLIKDLKRIQKLEGQNYQRQI